MSSAKASRYHVFKSVFSPHCNWHSISDARRASTTLLTIFTKSPALQVLFLPFLPRLSKLHAVFIDSVIHSFTWIAWCRWCRQHFFSLPRFVGDRWGLFLAPLILSLARPSFFLRKVKRESDRGSLSKTTFVDLSVRKSEPEGVLPRARPHP